LCPAAQTTLRGFKIIIESKFNNNHLKFNCDFKIHMAFEMITQKKKKKKVVSFACNLLFNYEFLKKKKKAQENDTKQISKTTKNKNKN